MELTRTRYEVRVGTLLSQAVVAAFRLPLRRIAVPRNSVYRLSVPADRDLGEVLHRLTESDVQVLEIRRCLEGPRRVPDRAQERPEESSSDIDATDATGDGVVVPFRAVSRRPAGAPRPD